MKFINKILYYLILVMLVCWSSSLQAQRTESGFGPPPFERIGQSGWQFLHLPTVARSAALADIKIGMPQSDATAIFGNPAKLVEIDNMDIAFSKINYVAGISYMTAAVAKNVGSWGVFGLHVASLDVGDMIRTENVENPNYTNLTYRSGDLETFTAGDFLAGISYARSITDRLSIGGNIGYIKETLDDIQVQNWNLDFGIFFQTGFRTLTLSMVTRNFGPDREFTGFDEIFGLPQSVRMPLDFRLGVSYDFIEKKNNGSHKLTGYLEGVHPNDSPEKVHTAIEYSLMEIFFIRAGYKFNYDEQGLTIGGGLNYVTRGMSGRIDYAYLDYGRLSSVHLFTIGFGL